VSTQETLFEVPPATLPAAEPNPEHVRLAERLPRTLRLGGMSWSYRGWIGPVYGASAPERALSARGLTAYARHPLLRVVEIDRSYYEPLPPETFADFAAQVPEDFRFTVKAHEQCTVARYPKHARYGEKRGEANPSFLDPAYAADMVVRPTVAGLGAKLAALLFQFPPQDVSDPRGFARKLGRFLRALPVGVTYAVELRNPELLTQAYVEALAEARAVHCHNLWTAMPTLLAQVKIVPPPVRRPLIVRWLLRHGQRYEDANARFQPFHRIVEEDVESREGLAKLVARSQAHGVPALILVDNKAEGCAPESIARLAASIEHHMQVGR
jgi:uncharacterized protein YecE (DUF72 family)